VHGNLGIDSLMDRPRALSATAKESDPVRELFFIDFLRKDFRDLDTFPSIQAEAAETASAVSANGWKESRLRKDFVLEQSEKNVS